MCVCSAFSCCCFVLLQTETHFVALAGLEFTKIHAPVPQGDIFKINHRYFCFKILVVRAGEMVQWESA